MSNKKIGVLWDLVPVVRNLAARDLLNAQCPSPGIKDNPQKFTFPLTKQVLILKDSL